MKGSFRDRAKQARTDLSKQHQQSYDRKDDKGFSSESVFDMSVLKELGIEEWKPEKGEHLIDVIPFFTGKNHPDIDEGGIAYNVDYWAHQLRDLGRFFVCKRTYKNTDPICHYIQKKRPEKDEWMKIKPTRRCAYLIWCHDDEKEEAKGIQAWDVAHYFFEAKVCAIQKDPKTGKPIVWSSFEKGKHIFFKISQSGSFTDSSGKKRDSMEFGGFQLVDRDNPMIPDHILDQSFSLDMAMRMRPSDEEISEAFYEGANSAGTSDQTEGNGEVAGQRQGQEGGRTMSALERAKQRVAQRREEEPKSDPDPEPEQEEQDQTRQDHDPEYDPESAAGVESDSNPGSEQETKSEAGDGFCPHSDMGGEFGVTIEQLAECDDCDIWKACKRRYHDLKSEPKTDSAPAENTGERKPKLARRG